MRKLLIVAVTALTLVGFQDSARAGDGGAIVAGIISGLALGGLAAAAAQQHYFAPYPAYGYRRVYYVAARECWIARRKARDDFGNVYFRRTRVCG